MSEGDTGIPNGSQGEPPSPAAPRLLSSWKEIAEFLGVTDRTAQEYEKSRGLPVKRIGRKVAVLESDLRAWQSTSLRPAPWWARVRVLQVWSVAATTALVVTVGAFAWLFFSTRSIGRPVTAAWFGSVLTAIDSRGRTVWQHSMPYAVSPDEAQTHHLPIWFGDLSGNGEIQLVTGYPHAERESRGWALYCFSGSGELRWSIFPQRTVRNSVRSFLPPYVLRSYSVFPSPDRDGTHWVAAAFVHTTQSPSVLVVVDSNGRTRGEYWHPGHIQKVSSFDLNGDGRYELLVGGVRHGEDKATLITFDPRNVHGTPQLPAGSEKLMLLDLPVSTENRSIFFPRSVLNRRDLMFNLVDDIQIFDDRIQVSVYEHQTAPLGYVIYTLDRRLRRIQDLTLTVSYINAMREIRGPMPQGWSPEEETRLLQREVRFVDRTTAPRASVTLAP